MKRIVYITTATFPARKASSIQVMQMCAGLAAAGAAVKLVARAPDRAPLSPAALCTHYDVPAAFEIDQRRLPFGPRASDRFQAAAIRRERGADVCYTRGRDVVAPPLALAAGMHAVVEVHGRPASARERWLLKWLNRRPRARLVAISEPLRSLYRGEYGFAPERFLVAPDGVDLHRFTPPLDRDIARNRLKISGGRWVVYIGGLYRGRGLETLFEAMAGIDARLLVVGGRDESEIETWRKMAANTAPDKVQFAGYQNSAAVPLFLAAADVLAMPYSSRTITPSGEDTTAWMSPLKMFEYMAAQRPIVATDLPAIRSVLSEGVDALLAPPDDPKALAEALTRLLSNPALAQNLAAAARAKAET
ncbi:MAG: glycosyltransferase family 4 protein, partial [Anaerolineales bacterium]